MCGRFALSLSPQDLARFFSLVSVPEIAKARYNIAPTQAALVVRLNRRGAPQADALRWGLIPHWAKNRAIGQRLINARNETLATKPAFRSALQRRRCVVPASGFFEWKRLGSRKQPFFITADTDDPLAMAGLWERWPDPQGGQVDTFTIITCPAPSALEEIHHRVPLLLHAEEIASWLDPSTETTTIEAIRARAMSQTAPELRTTPVRDLVNRVQVDGPECIEALDLASPLSP